MSRTTDFDGLSIVYDERVLAPRAWTAAQAHWAAEVGRGAPDGPVLELCTGAGHIGLLTVRDNDRRLVAVDLDPTAADFARRNAEAAGMVDRVEVRQGRMEEVLAADERFPVVVADPPWVTSDETGTFPEDPLLAIDGGADGLAVARACLEVIAAHLAEGGVAVLQLGSPEQAERLAPEVAAGGLSLAEVRPYERGALALLRLNGPARR